jgi:methionyl-tRNA formyltransferase
VVPRVIAFVDHEIGYRFLERMLARPQDIELVAAVTTLDNGKKWWRGVSDLCKKNDLPLFVYEELVDKATSHRNIDWFLLLSWKYLVTDSFVAAPKNGVINLHYSLLPELRGVYPINWAIIEGRKTTGVTFHYVNQKIDEGDLVLQKETSIYPDDTSWSLLHRLDDLALSLFDELCSFLNGRTLKAAPQKTESKVSYKSRAAFDAVREIKLERVSTAGEFLNLLRGLTFTSESKNAYFVDPETQKKVYISLNIKAED